MDEKVKDLYLGRDQNCAETTLRVASEEMGLGLSDDEIKLIGGFGGGMGCGEVCGILAAAVAAFGREMIEDRAHAVPELKLRCAAFTERFRDEFGSIQCADIKRERHKDGIRCAETVDAGIALLRQEIAEHRAVK